MNKLSTRRILFIAAVIIFMIMLALNVNAVLSFVSTLLAVLSPVIIGACLAFILNLLTGFFENRVFFWLSTDAKPRKKIKRALSIAVTLLLVIAIVALILLVIVPQVISTAQSIVAGIPAFADRAIDFVSGLMERFGVSPQKIKEFVLDGEAMFDKIMTFANTNLNGLVNSLVSFGGSLISLASDALLGVFIAIYFLADKERVLSQISRLLRSVLKERAYKKASYIGRVANKSFSNFISGQFIEAIILAMLCFIGMLIFKFPYAPVVAVIVGVCALIPIMGAWIGGGLSALLILTHSPIQALWFVVFYVVLQQLEGNFIYPKVVGMRVGLPGVWVLVSVIVGSGLYGAVGALAAVPTAAVLYTIAAEYVVKTEKREKEKNDRPLDNA